MELHSCSHFATLVVVSSIARLRANKKSRKAGEGKQGGNRQAFRKREIEQDPHAGQPNEPKTSKTFSGQRLSIVQDIVQTAPQDCNAQETTTHCGHAPHSSLLPGNLIVGFAVEQSLPLDTRAFRLPRLRRTTRRACIPNSPQHTSNLGAPCANKTRCPCGSHFADK